MTAYTGLMKSLESVAVIVALVLSTVAVPAAADDDERSFLWRVGCDGRAVYLLGSIHFMKPDAYPLSDAIEHAYAGARTVVFETDMEGMDRAAAGLMAASLLPDGATLAETVGPELYRRTVTRLEAAGLGAAAVERMKPWMVALTLTTLELMRAGYVGTEGIDAHFSARAKADGKRRAALETVDFQVSLFADLSPSEGEEFLRYTLDDLDAVIPMIDTVIAAWRSGDAAALERLLGDAFEEHDKLYQRFVVDRNRRWLPQIEALLDDDKDALVVVGALHLVGDDGLIHLLRRRGCSIEQL